MSSPTGCPDRGQLQAFGTGRLGAERFELNLRGAQSQLVVERVVDLNAHYAPDPAAKNLRVQTAQ